MKQLNLQLTSWSKIVLLLCFILHDFFPILLVNVSLFLFYFGKKIKWNLGPPSEKWILTSGSSSWRIGYKDEDENLVLFCGKKKKFKIFSFNFPLCISLSLSLFPFALLDQWAQTRRLVTEFFTFVLVKVEHLHTLKTQ